MPQPRRQSGRARSSASRSSGARKATGSRSGSRSTTQKRAAAARSTAQQRQAASRRRTTTPRRSAPARRRATPADDVRRNVQAVVEALSRGVVLSRDRLQEAMDDAVERGRMTRGDANALVADLLKRGREQTDGLRSDIEQLLGRGRAVGAGATDRAMREVDRARRTAGLARFPILNYDDLTAAQVSSRLTDLNPAELRKVRDYERRNANRKSVLNAIEKALA
jgi:hypothetical protein